MPRQNRVDPLGIIHAVPARGMFTGNRGIIHDPETKCLLRRRWTNKAWIICSCEFQNRRREPMGRNGPGGTAGWTELFFLDEVTALAAGHRPCHFCRRPAARDFGERFSTANGFASTKVGPIDRQLHRERSASGGPLIPLDDSAIATQPDGAMILLGKRIYAVRKAHALPWSFDGYGRPVALDELNGREARLITPFGTCKALSAGYRPAWHQSAGS